MEEILAVLSVDLACLRFFVGFLDFDGLSSSWSLDNFMSILLFLFFFIFFVWGMQIVDMNELLKLNVVNMH